MKTADRIKTLRDTGAGPTRQFEERSRSDTRRSSGFNIWSVVGGLVLATVAVAVITNLPDIKRYIRISRM